MPAALVLYGGCAPQTPALIAGAYPAPHPGVHFCTHKSEPKRRQPPSGWTPAFVQSVTIGFGTGQPLNFRWASGALVIGAVVYELRLSPRSVKQTCRWHVCSAGRSGCAARRLRWREEPVCFPKKQATSEGVSRSRTSSPPQVGSPEDSLIQWQSTGKFHQHRLGKQRGPGLPALFW